MLTLIIVFGPEIPTLKKIASSTNKIKHMYTTLTSQRGLNDFGASGSSVHTTAGWSSGANILVQ